MKIVSAEPPLLQPDLVGPRPASEAVPDFAGLVGLAGEAGSLPGEPERPATAVKDEQRDEKPPVAPVPLLVPADMVPPPAGTPAGLLPAGRAAPSVSQEPPRVDLVRDISAIVRPEGATGPAPVDMPAGQPASDPRPEWPVEPALPMDPPGTLPVPPGATAPERPSFPAGETGLQQALASATVPPGDELQRDALPGDRLPGDQLAADRRMGDRPIIDAARPILARLRLGQAGVAPARGPSGRPVEARPGESDARPGQALGPGGLDSARSMALLPASFAQSGPEWTGRDGAPGGSLAEIPEPAPASWIEALGDGREPLENELRIQDVVLGITAADALDIRMTVATEEARADVAGQAERLVADLHLVGAKVEALRVETGRGFAAEGGMGAAGGQQPGPGGQGSAMRQEDAGRAPRAGAAGLPGRLADATPAGGGKVDRYA